MNKRGIVEITDEFVRDIPKPRYSASWEAPAAGRPPYEAAFAELDDALAWARARARRVFVDVEDQPYQHLRYGLDLSPTSARPWPHSLPPPPSPVEGRGGWAYVSDDASWQYVGVLAVHSDGEAELIRQQHGFDLEGAIDWGRERAPVVIVETGVFSGEPLTSRRYSAGERDPEGERLARLRPRAGEATMRWRVSFGNGRTTLIEAPTRTRAEQLAVDAEVRRLNPRAGQGFTIAAPSVEPLEGS